MSESTPAIGRPLLDYIVENFAQPERELLHRMWRRAQQAGLPHIMIAPEQARALAILVKAAGVRRALDVGTLFGYSAANLALALGPRGRVVSIEVDARHAEVARANLEELGLAQRVEVICAPALEAMQRMDGDAFELLLVDADKANYANYMEEGVRLVKDGGLMAFDNVFAFGSLLDKPKENEDPDVAAIRAFNVRLARHPKIQATILPIGDGLGVGVVNKAPLLHKP
jgi:predicted O-methyltransferase YrrM